MTLHEGTCSDVRENYVYGNMIFKMTPEQLKKFPKDIVDVVSIQHFTLVISLYRYIRNSDSYNRSSVLVDQSFTIRRLSERSLYTKNMRT